MEGACKCIGMPDVPREVVEQQSMFENALCSEAQQSELRNSHNQTIDEVVFTFFSVTQCLSEPQPQLLRLKYCT